MLCFYRVVLRMDKAGTHSATSTPWLLLTNPSETLGDLNGTTQSQGLRGLDSVPSSIPISSQDPSSVLQTPHSQPGPAWTFLCVYLGGDMRRDLIFPKHRVGPPMLRASTSGASPKSPDKPVNETAGAIYISQTMTLGLREGMWLVHGPMARKCRAGISVL